MKLRNWETMARGMLRFQNFKPNENVSIFDPPIFGMMCFLWGYLSLRFALFLIFLSRTIRISRSSSVMFSVSSLSIQPR